LSRRVRGNGDEQDAFSRWRHAYHWHRGQLRKIKRRAGKRDRRDAQDEIRRDTPFPLPPHPDPVRIRTAPS